MVGAGPSEGLLEFLDVIWGERGTSEVNDSPDRRGDNADYVCVATIDKTEVMRKVMFEWPQDAAGIVTKIFRESAEEKEVYVLPATFKQPINTKKTNFKKSHTIWVDFDGNAPETWNEQLHGVPEPTMRIISSTADRQHTYWKLDVPVYDYIELESRTRTLAYELEADIGGWDCVQLLRPPYTTNYGYAKPERKHTNSVIVDELIIDRKYQLDRFGVRPDLVAHVSQLEDKLMPVGRIMTMYRWSEALFDDWDHIPDEDSKKRSDALVSMAHQAAELGWNDEAIYSLVFHMDDKIGKYKSRNDRTKRLNDIVDRVRAKHRLKDQIVNEVSVGSNNTIYCYSEILSLNTTFSWIVEELMAEKSFGLLVSPPGLGKTTLSLRLAMSIAAREATFLDHIIPDKEDNRQIMFFSLEMGVVHIKKFITDMKLSIEELEAVNSLAVYASGKEIFLDTPEGRQLFEHVLTSYTPKVIFIDSLNKIIRKSISDDDAIRSVTGYLLGICEQFNTSIIVLHHDRKRQEKQAATQLDDVYGSRFLTSEADFVITLSRTNNKGQLQVNYAKTRFGQEPETRIIERFGNLNFRVVKDANYNAPVQPTDSGGPESDPPDESPAPLWNQ